MSLSSEVDVEFNESTMEEYSRLREEISQLREENSKLQEENVDLQKKNGKLEKDCEDYEAMFKVTKESAKGEVMLLQTQVDELQSRLNELNTEIEAGHPSRELDDLLRKNADLIFVAEREIRVLHEAQIQLCERSSDAYRYLSSLAKKIVDKMDEVGQPDILSMLSRKGSVASVSPKSADAFDENSYLKHELLLANETIMERDEAIKSLLEGTEVTSPTNELDLQEHLAYQEEKIKKYEEEVELLKGVVAKLTSAADDESSSVNEDYEKIGRLTREMVKIRLGLGHVTPKEAYQTLKTDDALGNLTAKELEAIYDAGEKKRNKNTPIKRLKRIFSTKKKPSYSPIEELSKEEEVH